MCDLLENLLTTAAARPCRQLGGTGDVEHMMKPGGATGAKGMISMACCLPLFMLGHLEQAAVAGRGPNTHGFMQVLRAPC